MMKVRLLLLSLFFLYCAGPQRFARVCYHDQTRFGYMVQITLEKNGVPLAYRHWYHMWDDSIFIGDSVIIEYIDDYKGAIKKIIRTDYELDIWLDENSIRRGSNGEK